MKPFSHIKSSYIPINQKDIDTDLIIPADYLISTKKGIYGKHLFQRLRDKDKQFPLNKRRYKNAKILVARENFGCGSSREHAVWALLEYGIKVIIANSFADIFSNNSGKNGLVLVALPEKTINKLINNKKIKKISIDLENQKVTLWDKSIHTFPFDEFRKTCIINGLNDIEYILKEKEQISKWKKKRNKELFYQTTQKI